MKAQKLSSYKHLQLINFIHPKNLTCLEYNHDMWTPNHEKLSGPRLTLCIQNTNLNFTKHMTTLHLNIHIFPSLPSPWDGLQRILKDPLLASKEFDLCQLVHNLSTPDIVQFLTEAWIFWNITKHSIQIIKFGHHELTPLLTQLTFIPNELNNNKVVELSGSVVGAAKGMRSHGPCWQGGLKRGRQRRENDGGGGQQWWLVACWVMGLSSKKLRYTKTVSYGVWGHPKAVWNKGEYEEECIVAECMGKFRWVSLIQAWF